MSEFMLVGWVLFLLTLQIAIWRDVVRENLAETRAKEDLEFLRSKQAEWQADKQLMQRRIEHQIKVIEKLRRFAK